jgi:outer membrane protein OmpA-like peptidoglycan-associated protein
MKPLLLIVFMAAAGFFQPARAQKEIIFFAHNSHRPLPASVTRLDSLAAVFKTRGIPPLLTLQGHCDSTGSAAYNQKLSRLRTEAVSRLLDSLLQPAKPEIQLAGFGESQPLAANATEPGRQLNRRVEIIFTPAEEAPPPVIPALPETEKKPPPLEKIVSQTRPGGTIVLQHLNFQGGLHRLLPTSRPVLDELLEVMRKNPALVIDIQGHICCVPGDEDGPDPETGTNDLSVQRAKVVYEFLIRNGIAASRLSYRGFGHKYPLTAERTPMEQEQNRRVEIKIIRNEVEKN